MRLVTALGGNALLKRGEPLTMEVQQRNVKAAAAALAPLILAGHEVVITHGNGPQVGMLALQAEAPLDVLDAESEGMIGYMIELELQNLLPAGRLTAALLTQVRVSAFDPAFGNPTKPIGPLYSETRAEELSAARGWRMAPDGAFWRRVVPSPAPQQIMEVRVIEMLVRSHVTVICAGGGGIPVIEQADGSLRGVEAVVDKDHASALLARQLRADGLLLLTDVDAVYRDFGTPQAQPIGRISPAELGQMPLPAGSMGPKAEAACRFVNETGKWAAIGRLQDASLLVDGKAGTRISLTASA